MTTLRPHIDRFHMKIFLDQQPVHGWKILLLSLVSQARSQVTSVGHSQQGEAHDRFDQSTFMHYLINFVVADDQVHFPVF